MRKTVLLTAAAFLSLTVNSALHESAYSANVLQFTIDCEPESRISSEDEPFTEDSVERKEDCLLPNVKSRNSAILELALTIKTQADEFYLSGNTELANENYKKASNLLENINLGKRALGEPIGINSEFQLLNADIGYRLQLLQAKADFWGTGFLNHPSNPVKLMSELQSNFFEFEKVVSEINSFQTTSQDTGIQQSTLRALYAEASSEAQAELWKVDQSSGRIRSSNETKDYLLQRLVDNARRQEEIKQELRSVWNEVDQLGDQISSIALSAAAQAAGVSPELAAAITSDGDLEEKLLTAGTALLADPDFSKELVSAAVGMTELYEAAATAQAFVIDVQDALEDVERTKIAVESVYDGFRDGFRKENLVNLVSLGSRIISELPAEEANKILSKVSNLIENEKISIETILRVAKTDERMQTLIFPEISKLFENNFAAIAGNIVKDKTQSISAFDTVKLLLDRTGELPDDVKIFLIHTLLTSPEMQHSVQLLAGADADAARVQLAGTANVEQFHLPDLRREIVEKFGSSVSDPRPEVLVAAVAQALESGNLKLEVNFQNEISAKVKIHLGDIEFDVSEGFTKELFDAGVHVQSEIQSKNRSLMSLLDRISSSSELNVLTDVANFESLLRGRLKELIEGTPIAESQDLYLALLSRELITIEKALVGLANEQDLSLDAMKLQFSRDVNSALSASGLDTFKPIAGLLVGQDKVPHYLSQVDQRAEMRQSFKDLTPTIMPMPRQSEADAVPVEEQVATMIVANSVPGGAFVAAALSAAKVLGQMELAIQKGNELYNEDKALLKLQLHLGDMIETNEDAKDLAEYDQVIAEVRGRGAAASSNAYLQAIVQSSSKMSDAQAQARLRVPLAIFHAEQMRRTFDELNHALALWAGSSGSPRGTIERLVREDPQYIRLALDNDIQLYRWLVRRGEGDRTDLRSLVNHWRQIVAITTDVCRRVGCSPDAAVVGPVKQTGPISVRQLVGESQWGQFIEWANSNPEEQFSFKLFLTPSDDLFDAHLKLVRAVDVSAGIRFEGAKQVNSMNRSSLVHPGVAYVSEKNREYFKEFYPFSTKHDLSWVENFDTEGLRLRWSRNSDLSQRDFEGYGIFTIWELRVDYRDLTGKPEDLYVNFAYQYQNPEAIDPFSARIDIANIIANDVVTLAGQASQHQGFNARDVELVAGSSDICGEIRVLVQNISRKKSQRKVEIPSEIDFSFSCESI